MTVHHGEMSAFLRGQAAGTVDRIVTSPPYIGLPGRADTRELVAELLREAPRILTEHGTVTLIVGSAPGHPLLPYQIAGRITPWSAARLELHSLYIWNREGTLSRNVDGQNVTHDVLLHICRRGDRKLVPEISASSVIHTYAAGIEYAGGVSTPNDLAAILIDRATLPGDLVIDPLCGRAEIGVHALQQGRRFSGCDLDPACVEIANTRLANA